MPVQEEGGFERVLSPTGGGWFEHEDKGGGIGNPTGFVIVQISFDAVFFEDARSCSIVDIAAADGFPAGRGELVRCGWKAGWGVESDSLVRWAAEDLGGFDVMIKHAVFRSGQAGEVVRLWIESADGEVALRGQLVAEIMGVHLDGEAELAEIAQALGDAGLLLGSRQGREQQASEDADDRDDHEQFDQGET